MNSRTILGVSVLVLAILIGVGAAINRSRTTSSPAESASPSAAEQAAQTTATPVLSTTPQPGALATNPASANTIVMTETGFQPDTLTVPAGTNVCFVNNGTSGHWPASNNHPTHTLYSEFDPKKSIVPGDQWCFTFAKVGTWGFHDHVHADKTGTITVTGS